MSSVRFAPTGSTADKKPHFRFPSSINSNSNNVVTSELLYQDPLAVIPRPKSTQPHSQHTRYQTLSHDITPRGNNAHHHHLHPHHHHHHALQAPHMPSAHKDKPRPSSISKIPSQQLQSLMKPSASAMTAPAVRPRTQSLTDSSPIPSLPPSSSALQRTSWLVPHHHQSRTPSPSPSSGSRHSIGSIKKSLIETIDAYSCSLEDKLTLVAKLHAEVEAELTHLNHRGSSASTHAYHSQRTPVHDYNGAHARKEIEDTIRLIKHADRIKAHAIQQLKHDISHSHPSLHPPLAQSHHHPHHLPPHSSKLALLSRELH